jgi:hypothetical protein
METRQQRQVPLAQLESELRTFGETSTRAREAAS